MAEMITAIYEGGILRPLRPLQLQERQTVCLQILPMASVEQIMQQLISMQLLTPPKGDSKIPAPSLRERRKLAHRLGQATQAKPLSEIIIEERGEW